MQATGAYAEVPRYENKAILKRKLARKMMMNQSAGNKKNTDFKPVHLILSTMWTTEDYFIRGKYHLDVSAQDSLGP